MDRRKMYVRGDNGELEPINSFFTEHPKEGIWYVKRIPDGTSWAWLNEEITNLPKIQLKVQLENYRDKILLEWQNRGKERMEDISPYEIADILFDTIANVIMNEDENVK